MSNQTRLAAALVLIFLFGFSLSTPQAFAQEQRPRARELGIHPGIRHTGPNNAITDVPGVEVGQVTLIKGDNVRTGVTAILPHAGNIFQDKVAGAVSVYNAFGKLLGSTQTTELGQIETPIVLTNTLAFGMPQQRSSVGHWLSPETRTY